MKENTVTQPKNDSLYKTQRAALITDCAPYYKAIYEAIQKAQRCVFIVGWDIDSRIQLLRGDDRPDPGLSYSLIEIINRKLRRTPEVEFYLLKWESPFLYAKERERLPALTWRFKTPENVHFCIDRTAPYGASHHQKIIAVDDIIAFNGGMDIALGRWDTPEHPVINPWRKDPPPVEKYRPYHDIQMLVDGAAAKRLAELARWRWRRAAGYDAIAFKEGGEDVWPDSVDIDFRDISMDIVQTFPKTADHPECHDIEQMFFKNIAGADEFIFIENQFLTHLPIARALNKRLKEKPGLRILIFSSYDPQGPLEKETMWQGRIAFRRALEENIEHGRVALFYPVTKDIEKDMESDIRVHAKLMAIDDRILHVGAANLNSRSMGTDSECDLVCRASTREHRQTIKGLRDELIAGHTGKKPEDVHAIIEKGISLDALCTPDHNPCRTIRPIDDSKFLDRMTGETLHRLGDYAMPPLPADFDFKLQTSELVPPWRRYLFRVIGLVAAFVIAALIYMVAEHEKTILESIRDYLATNREQKEIFSLVNFVMATGVFTLLSFLTFPVTVLIPLTASIYGTLNGFFYALCGSLLSAAAGYIAGHIAGVKFLRRLLGPGLQKIDRMLTKTDIVNVAVFRNLPVAPFALTNLALGVSAVRFVPFMTGTVLGMLPGMAALCILGDSLGKVILDLSLENILYLAAGIFLWVCVVIIIQRWTRKWQKGKEAS